MKYVEFRDKVLKTKKDGCFQIIPFLETNKQKDAVEYFSYRKTNGAYCVQPIARTADKVYVLCPYCHQVHEYNTCVEDGKLTYTNNGNTTICMVSFLGLSRPILFLTDEYDRFDVIKQGDNIIVNEKPMINPKKAEWEQFAKSHQHNLFEGFCYEGIECIAVYNMQFEQHSLIDPHRTWYWEDKWDVMDTSFVKDLLSDAELSSVCFASDNIEQHFKGNDGFDYFLDSMYLKMSVSVRENDNCYYELPIGGDIKRLGVVGVFPAEKRVSMALFKYTDIIGMI